MIDKSGKPLKNTKIFLSCKKGQTLDVKDPRFYAASKFF
jgi:hypothetical protein